MQTDKTVNSCFILPILPHKIGNVRDFWDDVSEKYGNELDGQFKLFGVQKALVFLQTMPEKGDFMVMYLRSRDGFDKTFKEIFGSGMKCSKYFTDQFKDFTGLDLSKKENVPKVEVLWDWTDTHEYLEEKKMLKMPWCFAAPIKPGKTGELLKLAGEMGKSKMSEIESMFRHHDIVRSLTCLQHTPQGDFIVRHILASNPLDELVLAFTTCKEEMCSMAKKLAIEYMGIDFSQQKNVPNVNLLFKWDEQLGFQTAEQTIAYTE